MNKKRAEISSWIFPIILYFVYPTVGIYFIIFKVMTLVLKVLKNSSKLNKDDSLEEGKSQFNGIEPHDIDFSHDHNYNDNPMSRSNRSNTSRRSFETEINVRCPVCNADNFIDEIPTVCEYCGNKITSI